MNRALPGLQTEANLAAFLRWSSYSNKLRSSVAGFDWQGRCLCRNVDFLRLVRRMIEEGASGAPEAEKSWDGGIHSMKYLLLIYHDERAWDSLSESERQEIYGEYRRLRQQITSSGHYLDGSQLHSVKTARNIRVRDDKHLVTDGPFAETCEQLGGYFLIEASDIDEATAIAVRIPSARTGTIEIRALAETAAPTTA